MSDQSKALVSTGRKLIEGFIAPAAAIFGAIEDGKVIKRKEKFVGFLDSLVKYLRMDNFAALNLYVQQHQDEDWLTEGFDVGFRTILDTINELARKCASMMVAEYLQTQRVPDRDYKKFANFLSEVDSPVLRITAQLAEAIDHLPRQAMTIAISQEKYNEGDLIYEVQSKEDVATLTPTPDYHQFQDTCKLLIRNGFVSEWTGFGTVHAKGLHIKEHIASVDPHQFHLWERMHKYMTPVRCE